MGFEFRKVGLILALAFAFAQQSFAGVIVVQARLTLSTQNVPPSFSASDPYSKIISNLQGYSHMKVLNTSTCGFFLNVAYGSNAPPDNSPQNIEIYEYAKSPGLVLSGLEIANAVYVRSNCSPTGPATNGILTVEVW